MKVIALSSDASKGKSTTIRLLYGLLLVEGFEQVSGTFWLWQKRIEGDFRGILIWNGIKIGINSRGDVLKLVKADLERFKSQGCQIVIFAMRSFMTEKIRVIYPDLIIVNKKHVPNAMTQDSPAVSAMHAARYAANAVDAMKLRALL